MTALPDKNPEDVQVLLDKWNTEGVEALSVKEMSALVAYFETKLEEDDELHRARTSHLG